MLFAMLAALMAAPPRPDVFLGMSPEQQAVRRTFLNASPEFTPTAEQELRLGKDTVVSWTWSVKHNHGLGVQVYGPGGVFMRRLEDSEFPTGRVVICQDRFIVGGGNTLRVWDAQQQYKLVTRKMIPGLEQYHTGACFAGGVQIHDMNPYYGKNRVLRLTLPDLIPAK